MKTVRLDGQIREVDDNAVLGDLIPDLSARYSAAIIKETHSEESSTQNIRLFTSAGEMVIELTQRGSELFAAGFFGVVGNNGNAGTQLKVKWSDRQTVAFGDFKSEIVPGKKTRTYQPYEVILGCGGYDPDSSYLIFSKIKHNADHGADESGGVIGVVVSGRKTVSKWNAGDTITGAERIVSKTDTSNSFVTADRSTPLEDGMSIVTYVGINARGYDADSDSVSIEASESVEHMLIALKKNEFSVSLSASGFITDQSMKGGIVPQEVRDTRLSGTVTVRTKGKQSGSVYIYTKDIPGSSNHTVTGRVIHGLELVKLANKGCVFKVETVPPQIDLRGMALDDALKTAESHGIKVTADTDLTATADLLSKRVVIEQMPPNTIEVISEGKVDLKTVELSHVIGIKLDDVNAPRTCGIFREVTGLKWYDIGKMPLIFKFEDVTLFDPKVSQKITINIENTPKDEVEAFTLAMTNDSRKSAGLVGVRSVASKDFGPTSEPFEATNIIGRVIETEKIASLKEGDTVYIREVR
ncbi:MAG: methanogenesis marker 3 protein [Methanomicrobium sp.]|nr:methanogenesis marker 3 protein [Methanomicrobium sp.]